MSLESRHYVATAEDVAELTRVVIAAQKQGQEGRATYLKVLIATTQAELGLNPRQRTAPAEKLTAAEIEEQRTALEAVGRRFYTIVIKAARAAITHPDKGGVELNKRTTFARTALSVLRKWVKAGNDITNLVAAKTTKASITIAGRRRGGPSTKVLSNQTKRYSTRLEKTLATFMSADPEVAVEEWERIKARVDRILRRRTNGHAEARAA